MTVLLGNAEERGAEEGGASNTFLAICFVMEYNYQSLSVVSIAPILFDTIFLCNVVGFVMICPSNAHKQTHASARTRPTARARRGTGVRTDTRANTDTISIKEPLMAVPPNREMPRIIPRINSKGCAPMSRLNHSAMVRLVLKHCHMCASDLAIRGGGAETVGGRHVPWLLILLYLNSYHQFLIFPV